MTNGSMMGDRQLEQIREAGLVNVAVSLDGMEENHDHTRNVAGSFRAPYWRLSSGSALREFRSVW